MLKFNGFDSPQELVGWVNQRGIKDIVGITQDHASRSYVVFYFERPRQLPEKRMEDLMSVNLLKK